MSIPKKHSSTLGKFIVFEGIDGSGKTSQINELVKNLNKININVHKTSEPTSTSKALVKKLLLKQPDTPELYLANLFSADRTNHILTEMLEILMDGVTIICDRYVFSSYAYQSYRNNIPFEYIHLINSINLSFMKPDINIFLDVEPEICIDRLNKSRNNMDFFENYETLKKVKEKYLESFEFYKSEMNIIIIDGNREFNIIAEEILNKVKPLFNT